MSILSSKRNALTFVAALLIVAQAVAGPLYRPGQEQRTVTASSYQISVQKNGRIDVSLLNGAAVFMNAYPAILIDGESEWTELDIASRYTFRERVNDTLGQGQALIMAKGNCEWAVRTYSAQPFFTVQAVFINTTKKPVRIRAISPWRTGDTRKAGGVWLGDRTSQSRALVLDERPLGFVNTRLAEGFPLQSRWHTALYNAETGRSLIAGFLDLSADDSAFSLDQLPGGGESTPIELFQATTTFEEPVEVAPRERLEMPIIYFSVSESDPLLGLRRFGQALARYNGIRTERSVPRQFVNGDAASAVQELREIGWRTPNEAEATKNSAEFFQGGRSESARLNPEAPTSWDDVVEALCNSSRLFHLTPYFWRTNAGRARLDTETLTDSQRIAWLAGLALSGGVMHVELDARSTNVDMLRRFTPVIDQPARPIDLFRNDRPQIWALPMDDSGEHVVVGLFNWETDAPATLQLEFAELGLARDVYYTVLDVLPQRYLGTASEQLRVEVPAGSTRLLSLRRHMDRPMVLSSGDHFTTISDSADHSDWDSQTKTLSGSVQPRTGQASRITILLPDAFEDASSSSENAELREGADDRVVILSVTGGAQTPAEWQVVFE